MDDYKKALGDHLEQMAREDEIVRNLRRAERNLKIAIVLVVASIVTVAGAAVVRFAA
jgi:hypothetical protein